MKWFILLLSVVLAEGNVTYDCQFSQKVDLKYIADQWVTGAGSIPALSLRSVVAHPENLAARLIKIRADENLTVELIDYNQIVALGEDLITAIQDLWAQFQKSLEETPVKFTRSSRINKDLKKIADQLEVFLALKPGNQKIEVELSDMPAQPRFKSNNKNLTATDAFLHLAKVKDEELAAQNAFLGSILWNAWKTVRKNLRLLQYQYRNQILNNKVMPVYRKIVDDVYSSDIQGCVDDETWSRFTGARKSIVKLSDSYIKSVKTGEKCH